MVISDYIEGTTRHFFLLTLYNFKNIEGRGGGEYVQTKQDAHTDSLKGRTQHEAKGRTSFIIIGNLFHEV